MQYLYENYVESKLRETMEGYTIQTQGCGNRGMYLLDQSKTLKLKPDFHLTAGGNTIIIDTKWKTPHARSEGKPDRNDLYQLFAYSIKFHAKKVVLLYPKQSNKDPQPKTYTSTCPEVTIIVCFIDLLNAEQSFSKLACLLNKSP
ncbi:MAG: hypothetical protein LKI20_06620 [Bifidobacterium sp.]|nr:hypothetical protein [Bifidobacterium sp.]